MPILKVEMLKVQIITMATLLSEFDFVPVYKADLAGSRTLSFKKWNLKLEKNINKDKKKNK